MATFRQRQHEWINNIDGDRLASQHEEMTIYGPFGGPIRRAQDQLRQVQAIARSQFKGGTGNIEFVSAIETGDILVIVLYETSQVMFAGRDEPHLWGLRVTEVHQNIDGQWRKLHRHADPLQKMRPLNETLALLE